MAQAPMSTASSTSPAAPSGSNMSLSIGMVFSHASPPAVQLNPELRTYQPSGGTTIRSIAKADGSHLGARRKRRKTPGKMGIVRSIQLGAHKPDNLHAR